MSRFTRLEPSTTSLEVLAGVVGAEVGPVVLAGGSCVLMAAALAQRAPVAGVWVRVDEAYPAPLVARDVATLAWITPFDHVIVEGEDAPAHRAVIEALLTNDEVSFSNQVATLVGAYNRPAPPRPITLWHVEADAVVGADRTLRAQSARSSAAGDLVDFA